MCSKLIDNVFHNFCSHLKQEKDRQKRIYSIFYNFVRKCLFTLNFRTSSIRAVLPSLTHDWKKLGATETPKASLVMPVPAWAALLAITRNVPNSKTNKCCVYFGSDVNNLQRYKRNENEIMITDNWWYSQTFRHMWRKEFHIKYQIRFKYKIQIHMHINFFTVS